MLRLVPNSSELQIKLDFKGLCYIYLSTWPYILAEIKHFAALLIMTLFLIGFGTAVAFLGIDVLWDTVGRGEVLSTGQAKILFLPADPYTGTELLLSLIHISEPTRPY